MPHATFAIKVSRLLTEEAPEAFPRSCYQYSRFPRGSRQNTFAVRTWNRINARREMMNERNLHESTVTRTKWLAICMGTAMLISPLPGVAQSNTVQSSDKGTAPQTKTVRIWDACD